MGMNRYKNFYKNLFNWITINLMLAFRLETTIHLRNLINFWAVFIFFSTSMMLEEQINVLKLFGVLVWI